MFFLAIGGEKWYHNYRETQGGTKMALQESGEMYLETILVLSKEKNFVRAIDVGEHMGYSKPSVSRAMGLLKSGGFINVNDEGAITLTEEGLEVAEKIYERHMFISNGLIALGVDEETAIEDACRIEHVISDKSFRALKEFAARLTSEKSERIQKDEE